MDFFWSVNYDFGQPTKEAKPASEPSPKIVLREPAKKKRRKQKYNNSNRTRMSRGRR